METMKWIVEQIVSVFLPGHLSRLKKFILRSKLKRLIETEISRMTKEYDCSIITSDSFFRFLQYNSPLQRLQEHLMDMTPDCDEDALIADIVHSFDSAMSVESRRVVDAFFRRIYDLTRRFYLDYVLNDSDKILLAEMNRNYIKQARLIDEKTKNADRIKSVELFDVSDSVGYETSDRKGYLFINGTVFPFDTVNVQVERNEDYAHYIICATYYEMEYYVIGEFLLYVSFHYALHSKDVNDRLMGFEKILRIIDADKLELQIEGETDRQVFHSDFITSQEELVQDTRIWTEQMKLICALERKYGVKFRLPNTLSESDFYALEVMKDVMAGKPVASLILPELENYDDLQGYTIEKEELDLPDVYLFGERFCAVKAWVQLEDFSIRKQEGNVLIPLVVDFEVMA